MESEVRAAVLFLKRLLTARTKLQTHQLNQFAEQLVLVLQEKYKGHWYPDNPSKGQAYRCIRVNLLTRQDPEILRACQQIGVQYCNLEMPCEVTLWVDPGEVSYRFGEENLPMPLDTTTFLVSKAEEEQNIPHKHHLNPCAPAWYPQRDGSRKHHLNPCAPAWYPQRDGSRKHHLNPCAPAWYPQRDGSRKHHLNPCAPAWYPQGDGSRKHHLNPCAPAWYPQRDGSRKHHLNPCAPAWYPQGDGSRKHHLNPCAPAWYPQRDGSRKHHLNPCAPAWYPQRDGHSSAQHKIAPPNALTPPVPPHPS